MRTLSVFNNISLDGRFTDANGDMRWAHAGSDDAEFQAFTAGNAGGGGALMFGRVTYDMMAGWWPSPAAMQAMPDVAAGMNRMEKFVFSRSMGAAAWENTRVLKGDPVAATQTLKQGDGPPITIMGSGQIVSLLAGAGLIDEFQFVICPVVVGAGRTLFEGHASRLPMHAGETRAFKNGKIFARYTPA